MITTAYLKTAKDIESKYFWLLVSQKSQACTIFLFDIHKNNIF